jgi:hypothetical protein
VNRAVRSRPCPVKAHRNCDVLPLFHMGRVKLPSCQDVFQPILAIFIFLFGFAG